jgi:hypothetical protein
MRKTGKGQGFELVVGQENSPLWFDRLTMSGG